MRNWFYKQSKIGAQESKAHRSLMLALDGAHNRRTITVSDRQLLQGASGRYLYAPNKRGRLVWAKAVCSEFSDFFGLSPTYPYPDEQMFFVTLADKGCATAHDEKVTGIPIFIRKLRQGLNGLSYIGVIEPAYYVNIGVGAFFTQKRAVFWHLHAVCWGESAKEIYARIDRLNRIRGNYRPIAQGIPAAHVKQIPKKSIAMYHLADKFRYMLKSPKDSYRLYKRGAPMSNRAAIISSRQFIQRKGSLRPGERITLFQLMKDLYLDGLALAGGQGTNILRRAKRRALRTAPVKKMWNRRAG